MAGEPRSRTAVSSLVKAVNCFDRAVSSFDPSVSSFELSVGSLRALRQFVRTVLQVVRPVGSFALAARQATPPARQLAQLRRPPARTCSPARPSRRQSLPLGPQVARSSREFSHRRRQITRLAAQSLAPGRRSTHSQCPRAHPGCRRRRRDRQVFESRRCWHNRTVSQFGARVRRHISPVTSPVRAAWHDSAPHCLA